MYTFLDRVRAFSTQPDDWVRQSIPFTYISFDLSVTDDHAHDIQLYMHMQSG